jgi:hypothetical protein
MFEARLSDNLLRIEMRTHFATEEEARAAFSRFS